MPPSAVTNLYRHKHVLHVHGPHHTARRRRFAVRSTSIPRPLRSKNLDKFDRPLYAHIWKRILSSGHRTLDPGEADFFYVPVDFRWEEHGFLPQRFTGSHVRHWGVARKAFCYMPVEGTALARRLNHVGTPTCS